MATRKVTVKELLKGRQQGWREREGRKVATELDPVRLVQHFRRIGAGVASLRSDPDALVQDVLLEVLYLALLERGWIISKRAVIDAWRLASLDPQGPDEGDDPF